MIDRKRVLELMAEVVAEAGADWTYPDSNTCRYRWSQEDEGDGFGREGEPACIVGVVLHKLDLLDEVAPLECEGNLIEQLPTVREHFTEGAITTLQRAQGLQDCDFTWGEALSEARTASSLP